MAEARKNKFKVTESSSEPILKVEHPEQEENSSEPDVRKMKRPKKESRKEEVSENSELSLAQRIVAFIKSAVTILKSEKSQRIIGVCYLLVGFCFFLSLASFFFTWEIDQDKVMGPMNEFFSPAVNVENWFGKFGALTAHLFMHKWFGVSSFFIVPLLFGEGFRKIMTREIPFLRQLKRRMVFFLVWTSLSLGFFFSQKYVWMGGGFGYVLNQELIGITGFAGTIAILSAALLIFLVLSFNFSFNFKKTEDPIFTNSTDVITEESVTEVETSTNKVVPLVKKEETIEEPELTEEEKLELLNFEVKRNEVVQQEVEVKDNVIEFSPAAPSEEKVPEVVIHPAEVQVTVEQTQEKEILLRDEDIESKSKRLVEEFGEFDPTLELGTYQFPTIDLLNDYGKSEVKVSQEEFTANNDKIVSTLKNYGIEIEKIKVTPGPTVTLYEIVPAAGVRISKIKNLEDDIALSLSALGIRIIAPIPGKGTIGIEVPNLHPEMVPMKNILASEKFQNSNRSEEHTSELQSH